MLCAAMLIHDDPSPWLAVLGRAHPLVLHLPLGILPCTVLLEFGSWLLRRQPPRGAIIALSCLGAVAGALATVTGLVLAGEHGYGGDALGLHKWLGITLGVLLVLAALLAPLRPRLPLRIVLAAGLLVMLPAGHLGGSMTHGDNFLFEPVADLPPADASEFVRTIQPILKRSCVKCHNPTKLKGELDLTTIEGIKKGGESGEVIVAGKPDESELLRLCSLPEDDDDVMPPTGKRPRPTAEQLQTLRAWIEAGARFD